jgi:hypothetical protein
MATLKSTDAGSTRKSLPPMNQPVRTSRLHLALDVVAPSEIQPGTISSGPSQRNVSACLLSIVLGLQSECLSGDVWYLALSKALDMALEFGVPQEEFVIIVKRLEQVRAQRRAANPLSGMF